MIGIRWRIAISWARRILRIVSGHHDPAFTVASLATTTTGRPEIRHSPVPSPAAVDWPQYWQLLHSPTHGEMPARQYRHAHHIHVFLYGRLQDHFRGPVQAAVNDFHAGVAQRAGHDLRPAVVPVQPGLGHQYPNRPPRAC